MFFGHWEYIDVGGLDGVRGVDGWRTKKWVARSSPLRRSIIADGISTFPSTTMPRELYAIRYTSEGGRGRTRLGKVGRGKKSVPEKLFKCVK